MIQEQIEQLFSKRNRKDIILGELTQEDWFNEAINKSVYLLQVWFQKEHSSKEKIERVGYAWGAKFHELETLESFIEDIFVATSQVYEGIPLVSVAAMLCHHMDMLDKKEGILTMAEILTILADIDLYDLYRHNNKQICLRNRIQLEEDTLQTLNRLMYLPPMISEPKIITSNRDSYHFSLKPESIILGNPENFHTKDICLDVLNTLSQQVLSIDREFIRDFKPIKPEGMLQENWDMYIDQLEYIYGIIGTNNIFIPYKPDMRGRVYSQGYHTNTQGDDYHKAVIELANKVHVDIEE